jgi:hypothetical protein
MPRRKKTGRPATGITPMVGLRLVAGTRRRIEQWAAKQSDEPSLSEAIRRLVETGLAATQSTRPLPRQQAKKAAELAGQLIDRLGDRSIPQDERASRKRRLLKGPKEFRDLRRDHPTKNQSK